MRDVTYEDALFAILKRSHYIIYWRRKEKKLLRLIEVSRIIFEMKSVILGNNRFE